MKRTISSLTAVLTAVLMWAQTPVDAQGTRAYPADCNGLPIKTVQITMSRNGRTELADSLTLQGFYNAFNLHPGSTFSQAVADIAMLRIKDNAHVATADYALYSASPGTPVTMVVSIDLLGPDQHKDVNGREGMAVTRSARDFPLIYQDSRSQLSLILNGGVGLFDDVDGFFGQGVALNQGNPIATDPEGTGSRFWGEAFIEPGIAGIIRLGHPDIYAYGAVSAIISGRNASDAFSHGGHAYIDFEKLYAGVLFSGIGPEHNQTINLSAGRQEFQLNDGFLISRFSGSANAGPRASTYLNSRRAMHMTAVAKWSSPRFTAEAFYIQPQELTRHAHARVRYAGAYAGYNSAHFSPGLAFVGRIHGEGDYYLPDGSMLSHKGLLAINPKLYITDIADTGLFFKTEYVHEWHTGGGMAANAWYAGLGADLRRMAWTPRVYYRYAFMQGDNPDTKVYTRYDPVLSGGLAEWVQGMNMCKVVGTGNIITHRVEVQVYPSSKVNLELDYYHLRADRLNNVGGAAVLSHLKSKHLGDEVTLQCNWNINSHFMVLGLVSFAFPGAGIRDALPHPVRAWQTYQLNLFMFF